MRHYFKSIIITSIGFYLAASAIPTIKIGSEPQNILIVLGSLLLVSIVIHPIFSIILIPVNILTFGLLSFIINIALLFAFIKFLPGFSISPYNFPGANIEGVIIPSIYLDKFMVVIAAAAIITIANKILKIIFD